MQVTVFWNYISTRDRRCDYKSLMKIKKLGDYILNNTNIIPIWEKMNLTLNEAAKYSGIGVSKLRELSDVEGCPFVLWNGTKRLIKRKKLEEYCEKQFSI